MIWVQSLPGACGAGVGARVAGVAGSEDALDGADEAVAGSTGGLVGGGCGARVVLDEGDIGSPAGGRETETAGSELGVYLIFVSVGNDELTLRLFWSLAEGGGRANMG